MWHIFVFLMASPFWTIFCQSNVQQSFGPQVTSMSQYLSNALQTQQQQRTDHYGHDDHHGSLIYKIPILHRFLPLTNNSANVSMSMLRLVKYCHNPLRFLSTLNLSSSSFLYFGVSPTLDKIRKSFISILYRIH